MGANFLEKTLINTEWAKIGEAAMLSQTKKRELIRNCFKFIYDTTQAIAIKFSEMDFITGYDSL